MFTTKIYLKKRAKNAPQRISHSASPRCVFNDVIRIEVQYVADSDEDVQVHLFHLILISLMNPYHLTCTLYFVRIENTHLSSDSVPMVST